MAPWFHGSPVHCSKPTCGLWSPKILCILILQSQERPYKVLSKTTNANKFGAMWHKFYTIVRQIYVITVEVRSLWLAWRSKDSIQTRKISSALQRFSNKCSSEVKYSLRLCLPFGTLTSHKSSHSKSHILKKLYTSHKLWAYASPNLGQRTNNNTKTSLR